MSSLLSPPSVRGGEDSAEIALKASMEQKPIYINNFTGQAENPNVGSGVYVGIDLFTTKTVARLSRKMQKKSGSVVTDLPIYFTTANNGYIYCQDEAGKIYVSVNQGDSWSVVTGNSGDDGKGLIVWQDYLFSFTPDDIDIYGPFSGAPSWTNGWWTDAGGANQPALSSLVGVNHYPYNDPAQASIMYFCNNNKICSIELSGSGAAFDPADSSTYVANESKFVMQDFYNAKVIGYLPPSSIAIGVENRLNAQADAVIWDGVQNTTAINVVTVPGASNPITQMITRNGVLYCVTDKEHGVYILNGSSAQLVDRLALRMSNRTSGGRQYTTRVSSTVYPSAIDFLGPELLTAGANFPSPVTQISGTGLYPYGVWSVNIEPNPYGQGADTGGTGSIGLRFPLSFGDINANYNTNYAIGAIKVTPENLVLVGWKKGSTYGIDKLNAEDYISDSNTVFLDSSLYLAGTRLQPRTFNTFQFNLVAPLNAGEETQFYYRKSVGEDYQPLDVAFTATRLNGELAGVVSSLPFQNARYIQIAAKIKSGSTPNLTPQIRDAFLL